MLPPNEQLPELDELVAERVDTSAPNAAIRSYSLRLTNVGKAFLSVNADAGASPLEPAAEPAEESVIER